VADALQTAFPDLTLQTSIIKTRGDLLLDAPPSGIGEKGLFTSELEKELLNGSLDIAVHSLKDLPADLEPGLCVGAVLKRENPLDVLVSSRGLVFSALPSGATIGTASLRRTAQIKALRPDVAVVPVRGNVETRIKKMREQGLDAIVLAYAGIVRLGLAHMITEIIPPHSMLPAPGQGAIAVEARADDGRVHALLQKINDRQTCFETRAERSFLRRLHGGCQVPIGCLARMQREQLSLQGCVASLDGTAVYTAGIDGQVENAEALGAALAEQLLADGAAGILAGIIKK
jgi:hydroxymethylbilane synthase